MATGTAPAQLTIEPALAPTGALRVVLAGAWRLRHTTPAADLVIRALAAAPASVVYDSQAVSAWDGSLLAVVARINAACATRGVPVDVGGLPAGAIRLLALATRAPARPTATDPARGGLIERIGRGTLALGSRGLEVLGFIGGLAGSLRRFVTGRAQLRGRDLLDQLQICGADALGIVMLVCFLVGIILAFVGAIELKTFGVDVYVADLVGVAVVREMGALMVAIVVAGRTGAAFAAELGTMRVTQELDALDVLEIPVLEFLVLPRMLALALMMPLLTLFADLVGVLGGALIGIAALGIEPGVYYRHTIDAVTLGHLAGGLFKAASYGVLIGGAGCYAGLGGGSSAAAVGQAATSAVVTSIVLVICACGTFAAVFYAIGL